MLRHAMGILVLVSIIVARGLRAQQAPQLPQPRLTPSRETPSVAVLAGWVVDDESGEPIAGAVVTMTGTSLQVVSNAKGRFEITSQRGGDLELAIRRVGFYPSSGAASLRAGDTTRASFFLRRIVQKLDTVSVTASAEVPSARLTDFERRRKQHVSGVFLTRADIERRHAVRSSSLFMGLLGVRVVDSCGVKYLASGRGARANFLKGKLDLCYLPIGIDGLVQAWRSVDEIPVSDIEAIEIYPGPASVPRELMSFQPKDGFCGIVMIWSRSP